MPAQRKVLEKAGQSAGQQTLFGLRKPSPPPAKAARAPRKSRNSKQGEEAELAADAEQAKQAEDAEQAKQAMQAEYAEQAKRAEDASQAKQAEGAEQAKQAKDLEQAKQAEDAEQAKRAEDAEQAKQAKDAEQAKQAEGEQAKQAEGQTAKRCRDPADFELAAPELGVRVPRCHRCKAQADPLRCRMSGKSAACWCCPKCNTKGTQLTRRFGKWPPEAFAKLPKDYQERFWRECREDNIGGGMDLEEKVVKTLLVQRIEVEESKVGGKYLPLSVYERKGFDVARIQRECKDVEHNEVLGLTYRVQIKSVFSKTIEQMIRAELQEHIAKAQSKKRQKSRSRSSRSSRSKSKSRDKSSRSSRSKSKNKSSKPSRSQSKNKSSKRSRSKSRSKDNAHGKGKKDQKDKRDKEKAEKERDREQHREEKAEARLKEKNAKDNVKLATLAPAKVSHLAMMLKSGTTDKHYKEVPPWAGPPAKAALEQLEAIIKESNTCIKKRGYGEPLSFDATSLKSMYGSASEKNSLLASMLDTARKHA